MSGFFSIIYGMILGCVAYFFLGSKGKKSVDHSIEVEEIDKETKTADDEMKAEEVLVLSTSKRVLISLVLLLIGFLCGYNIWDKSSDVINLCKTTIALFGVTAAACVDLREHRIPNKITLLMFVSGLLLLAIGYCTEQNGSIAYITSSFLATIVCALGLFVASFITKGGIGIGDIKLLCSIAMLGGVITIIYVLFVSMLLCGIVSGLLLLTGKKTIQDVLPFGPFILIGFVTTVCLFVY